MHRAEDNSTANLPTAKTIPHTPMSYLTTFSGVWCSGLFIDSPALVTASSLLFEKIYLPNNIDFVLEFAKHYKFRTPQIDPQSLKLKIEPVDHNQDPFHDLNDQQRITALTYLDIALKFSRQNIPLYGEVFETSMYPDGEPLHAELIKKGGPGQLNTYRVYPKPLTLIGGDKEQIPTLIQKGYIPLVGSFGPSSRGSNSSKEQTAKQLAALLAMKSVEMIFPATKGVDPKLILEARDRLSDHLPPFWAAMLKLSIELRARIKDCKSPEEVFREADFMVDTLVRPAAIDLKRKIELERKKWFYKILMPIQAGLRLLIGKPILTQQQLLTSALILGADVALASAENMKIIEALKNEAGLTFLLEAGDTLRK